MRTISAMYEWSGGTDSKHTCHDCKQCKFTKHGKRNVFVCLNYDGETPWKDTHIACKFFDIKKPVPLVKLEKQIPEKITVTENAVQLSLFDFIGG